MENKLFKTEQRDGAYIIVLPRLLDAALESKLDAAIKTWQLVPVDVQILDFKEVRMLSPSSIRLLTIFYRNLHNNNKKLFSVNMTDVIYEQVISSGLKSVFSPVKTKSKRAV